MSTFPDVPAHNEPDHEVLLVAGSRAEVARLAPVARAMIEADRMQAITVAAGAEPMTVFDAFDSLGVDADVTLLPGEPLYTLAAEAASVTTRLDALLVDREPSAVLVSGGTVTAVIAAQVAFWRKVPVVHLHTGLVDDLLCPFPQEANRRMIGQLASLYLLTAGTAGLGTPHGPNAIVIGDPLEASPPPVDPALAAALERAHSGRPLVTVAVAGNARLWQAAAELPVALPDAEVVAVPSDLGFCDLLALLSGSTLLVTDDLPLGWDATGIGVPTLLVDLHAEFADAASASVVPEPRRIVRGAMRLLDLAAERPVARTPDALAAQRAEQAMAWMFGLRPAPPTVPVAVPSPAQPTVDS